MLDFDKREKLTRQYSFQSGCIISLRNSNSQKIYMADHEYFCMKTDNNWKKRSEGEHCFK